MENRKNRERQIRLSDLEAGALGTVHRYGPCTAHFVRRRFGQSASPRFSDSAGSIYPMMRRLWRKRLLHRTTHRDGQRDVDYYRATAAGRRALRQWIGPPMDPADSLTIDPLRTKVMYLNLLTRREQEAWLREARILLAAQMRIVNERLEAERAVPQPDAYLELAHQNARLELKARSRWLALVHAKLGIPGRTLEDSSTAR